MAILSESLEQQTATSDVLRVIASAPADLQAVLDKLFQIAALLFDASDVYIRRLEGNTLHLVATSDLIPNRRIDVPVTRDSIAGRQVLERRTIHVPDLERALDEFPEAKSILESSDIRTVAGTPLLLHGEAIGNLGVRRSGVRPFSDSQIALIETFANQAVIAIENARLFGELQERTRELAQSVDELQALGAVSQTVSSTLDLKDVLDTVLGHAVQLSGMDGGSIFEYDTATGIFDERSTQGLGQVSEVLRRAPLRAGEGLLGRAAELRQPLQVEDILDEGAYQGPMRHVLVQAGYRAMLAVPLIREDEIIGGLVVRRGTPGAVAAERIALLQTFASQSALAIQNARLFNQLAEKVASWRSPASINRSSWRTCRTSSEHRSTRSWATPS